MSDNVKHPSHYAEGRNFEPKDVIRDWGLNFNLGSAVKYLARAGRKADTVEDLKKAQEFIQFEIDAIEAEKAKVKPATEPKVKPGTITLRYAFSKPEVRVYRASVYTGTPLEHALHRAVCEMLGGK